MIARHASDHELHVYRACTQCQGTHDLRNHANKHTKAMSDLHRHAKLALVYFVAQTKKISGCASPRLGHPRGLCLPTRGRHQVAPWAPAFAQHTRSDCAGADSDSLPIQDSDSPEVAAVQITCKQIRSHRTILQSHASKKAHTWCI